MAVQEDEVPEGAPEWMVTYSDMISLLVTFFILLMTFSTSANDNDFPIAGDLFGPGGILGRGGRTSVDPPEHDIMAAIDVRRGADVPHSRPAHELPESLEEMGQKLTEDQLELDLRAVKDGIVIHFGERASFRPGSTEVEPALKKSLEELGRVLEHYPFLVVVEGFTDAAFKPTVDYPSPRAMGCARARAAAQVMLDGSNLSSHMVQIAGLGDTRPLNANATAAERTANRRVEVRILSLSRQRAQHAGEES